MRPQGSIQKPGTSPRISGSSPTAAGMAGSPKKVRVIDISCSFATSFPCVTPLFDGACEDNNIYYKKICSLSIQQKEEAQVRVY